LEPTDYSVINETTDRSRIDTQTSSREIVAKRLEEAGISTKRFCQVHKQKVSFTHHQSLYKAQDLPTGNYGVKGLDDLVIIDVDDWDSTPNELKELISKKPTFTVQTPHSEGKEGHYYFKCNEFVPDKSPDWGDVQSDGSLAVGPGSVLESCNKNWHYCSQPGHGQYVIKENRPIESIKRAQIPISDDEDEGVGQVSSPTQNAIQYELPAYEKELADVGNAILRDLESVNSVSHIQLRKLLEGGVGRYADQLIKTENGEERIDRSHQENLALLFLYGAIRQVGNVTDEDRAEGILYATFDHHMKESPKTTYGQRRKWLERGDDYHANRVGSVVRDFDRGEFIKFLNLSSSPADYRFRSGKCSEPNFNMARFAVDLLSGEWDNTPIDELADLAQSHYNIHIEEEEVGAVVGCNEKKRGKVVESIHPIENRDRFDVYPTKTELYEAVREFGSNLSSEESLRKNVLDELKESGMVKLASNGKRHVYYSSHLPDPEGAYYIRTEGSEGEI
jgi:hypothetical protein